jgi:hypothetical protein
MRKITGIRQKRSPNFIILKFGDFSIKKNHLTKLDGFTKEPAEGLEPTTC